MIKKAYSYPAHIGAALGAGIGAFSMRSPFKHNRAKGTPDNAKNWEPISKKRHALRILKGTAVGALGGGLIGFGAHRLHLDEVADHVKDAKFWKSNASFWRKATDKAEEETQAAHASARRAWDSANDAWSARRSTWNDPFSGSGHKSTGSAGHSTSTGSSRSTGKKDYDWGTPYGSSARSSGAGSSGAGAGSSGKKDYDYGSGSAGSAGKGKSRWSDSFHADDVGEMPDWLKGVKTKAEAKSRFRDQAKKHHPDAGGDEEAMKKINAEWARAKGHHGFPKTASVYNGFADELFNIYWSRMR